MPFDECVWQVFKDGNFKIILILVDYFQVYNFSEKCIFVNENRLKIAN